MKESVGRGRISANSDMAELYQKEGYLVIRDFDRGQLPFENSLHLFFTAAAHEGLGHGHADALSFVLHASGRDILIDHGYYSYRQDEGRAYIRGVASHNTVMVDGMSYDGCDSQIDRFVSGAGYSLLRASHRNYTAFEHERWFVHVSPDLIIVVDRVDPRPASRVNPRPCDNHVFEQLWHLAHDLDALVDSSSRKSTEITFVGADRAQVMKLTQFKPREKSLTVRIAKGEKAPLMGWTSIAHAQLIPSPVVISGVGGSAAQFVSVMDLSTQRRDWQLDTDSEDRETVRLRWNQGGSDCSLALDLVRDELRIVAPGFA